MSETRNLQRKGKLKASMDEFVGPVLKQLTEANNHEDYSSIRANTTEILMLVMKMKAFLVSRKSWDSKLIGYFQKIERQIDYRKENKGENHVFIDEYEWEQIKNDLEKLFLESGANLSKFNKDYLELGLSLQRTKSSSSIRHESTKGLDQNSSSPDLLEYMEGLDQQHKDCLYILGIFPENMKLKKRLLLYWWIALGLVPSVGDANTPTQKRAEDFFSDLVEKEILLVHKIHNRAVNWCIVNPKIYEKLVSICEFTDKKCKGCTLRSDKSIPSGDNTNTPTKQPEENKGSGYLIALQNSGQKKMYLNSEDITDVISENRTMQVVHLGKYTEPLVSNQVAEIESKDHIEVDKTEFLKKLDEKVTYLSLQDISLIEELPESIGKLEDLRILDLKACHNLQKLPQKPRSKFNKILRLLRRQQKQQSWFKNLTYLDISDCYMLDHIPIWVCELSNLEVLKGFVAGNADKTNKSCQIVHLSKLKKLKKLGIKIANSEFKDLSSLGSLNNLSVLTVIWSIKEQFEGSNGKKLPEAAMQSKDEDNLNISELGGEEHRKIDAENQSKEIVHGTHKTSGEGEQDGANNVSCKFQTIVFPEKLEKLDIRCYPKDEAPELLNPGKLKMLKRLYIRGGKLAKIDNKSVWDNVEIFRLRYLEYLEYSYYHVRGIFPKLSYMEYFHCSKLKYFPQNSTYWSQENGEDLPDASEEPREEHIIDKRVKWSIIQNEKAPLAENNHKMMFELTASNSVSPDLDLVAVLDVSKSMTYSYLKPLKAAMRFVINKLRPDDRLSIVTFSTEAEIRKGLNKMTEDYKMELKNLVMSLEAGGQTNIIHGLQMGLKIINDHDRNGSSGRASAIILLSGGKQNGGRNATDIPVSNVAVYTFGIGNDHDSTVLKDIAYNSMGGTFSDNLYNDNLPKAVAVCLAGLLTVVAQDLTLTISPIIKKSEVKKVSVGRYPLSSDVDGSVTVKLGDLYSSEVRKVLVDLLLLPATDEKEHATDLKISYSYMLFNKLYKGDPVNVYVSRTTEVPADQQQAKPVVLVEEETRQKVVEIIREATDIADSHLEGAEEQKSKALEVLADVERKLGKKYYDLFKFLRKDVGELSMEPDMYEKMGRSYAHSFLTSHDTQRTTVRGHNFKYYELFSGPPDIPNFLKQVEELEPKVAAEEAQREAQRLASLDECLFLLDSV